MIASYRDPRYAASVRIEQLRERLGQLTEELPDELVTIHARRTARTWGGAVAIGGFGALVVWSAAFWAIHDRAITLHPTHVLVLTVALSIATYLVVRATAARTFGARMRAAFDASGDPISRLARMEATTVRTAAVEVVSRREKASFALPMMGIGLVAPLSMHLLVWTFSDYPHAGTTEWLTSFDGWIGISLVAVGLAHLTLAFMAHRFASRTAELPLLLLQHKAPVTGWSALGYTVLLSTLPGIVLIGIPVLIVAVTGILFVPWMFSFMYRRALSERHALGAF